MAWFNVSSSSPASKPVNPSETQRPLPVKEEVTLPRDSSTSILRQALVSKRSKQKQALLSPDEQQGLPPPPPYVNPLPLDHPKISVSDKSCNNSDLLDLDLFVYREMNKSTSTTSLPNINNSIINTTTCPTTTTITTPHLQQPSQAINNSDKLIPLPDSSKVLSQPAIEKLLSQPLPPAMPISQPNTNKLLDSLAHGRLPGPPAGVSLPTCPLPVSVVFPCAAITSVATSSSHTANLTSR